MEMLKRAAILYSRLCWYIVTRLFPLTAEQIWSQGFVKGVELAEQDKVWLSDGSVFAMEETPEGKSFGYWSGSA